MAKTRRRRYYTRKTRWASNIQEIGSTIYFGPGADTYSGTATLVTNPAQNSIGTSTIFTVKNIEATIQLGAGDGGTIGDLNNVQYYIMFVPQGMNVGVNYNIEHPEYIMNYRFIGEPETLINPNGTGRNLIRIKSRLSRKLNTGDSVILFVKGNHTGSTQRELFVGGLVRWWTKSN